MPDASPLPQRTALEVPTDFVFRHAGGCLLESPDMPAAPHPASRRWRWAATVWTDDQEPDGWGALSWRPGERGWELPVTTTVGDVVEFGVGWTTMSGESDCARWWGWIARCSARAVVVVGRYDHPIHAANDARAVIDELRLGELVGPDIVDAVAAALGDVRRLD